MIMSKGYSIWDPQGGDGLETQNKNVRGGFRENKMCGGASGIFSSPSPPEDFKWNSPNMCELWMTRITVLSNKK